MSRVIKLTHWDRKKAEKFADLRMGEDQTLYKRRGGFKREDIVIGALAEIGVYKLLREYGIIVTEPDFAIHKKGKKTFNADLTDYTLFFHVKGQSIESSSKYGTSWLMQKTDPIITKPQKCHYLTPTVVDLISNEVEVFGVFNINSILDKQCLDAPKIDWLARTKVAIYNDYLDATMTDKARWGLLYRKGVNRK